MVKWIDRLLGVVFVLGAALKAFDLQSFAVQIMAYHVISDKTLVREVAFFTVCLETVLGIALLLSLRVRGLLYAVTLALVAVFTGLIAYAWAFHGLSDCGCFGTFITMPPAVSIVKNVVLIALIIVALVGSARAGIMNVEPSKAQRILVGGTSLFLVLLAGTYGTAHQDKAPPVTPVKQAQQAGPFAQFVFDAGGKHYDLGKGEYFVAMLSSTCEDCMSKVPALNDLAQFPEVPRVVSLIIGTKDQVQKFRDMTGPDFPTFRIDKLLFFDFIGSVPPRFILIRDGSEVTHWDEKVPSLDDILNHLNQSEGGAAPGV